MPRHPVPMTSGSSASGSWTPTGQGFPDEVTGSGGERHRPGRGQSKPGLPQAQLLPASPAPPRDVQGRDLAWEATCPPRGPLAPALQLNSGVQTPALRLLALWPQRSPLGSREMTAPPAPRLADEMSQAWEEQSQGLLRAAAMISCDGGCWDLQGYILGFGVPHPSSQPLFPGLGSHSQQLHLPCPLLRLCHQVGPLDAPLPPQLCLL